LTISPPDVRRGSQTPRVSNYPAYDLSAAPEIIDLARTAGLILDPWQQYVLTHGLGMHADGEWTARRVSCWVPRQNGKGAIIEALELAWLFLLDEELIIHSAHQHRTSKRAYARLEKLIRRTPSMFKRVKAFRQTNGEHEIELHDGRLLQYTTRSRTAVRGFSAPKLVLDEAQELTGEQIAAMMPTVSAMPNWQIWFFGTPPDDQAAWVYGLKEDGEAGRPRLAHFDWGVDLVAEAPGTYEKAADIELAFAANPAMGDAPGCRIEPATVEDEYRPSGLGTKYPQERLGAWKPRALEGGGVIDPRVWADLGDPSSRRDGDVALAVDVTPLRTHASIAMYGVRADGLGHVQVVTYGEGVDWVVGKLAELKRVLDPVAIGLDPKGGASSLLGELEAAGIKAPADSEHPERGDLALPLAHEVAQATGQFIDAVRERRLRHVGQPELTSAVANAKTRPLLDAVAWGRKQSDVDISPLVGVTLARWAYVTRINAKPKAQELSGSLMA
jgi:phage terminase large subunit-like protein